MVKMLTEGALFFMLFLYKAEAHFGNLQQSLNDFARKVGEHVRHKFDINRIDGYGCWCHFKDHTIGSRGEPRDLVDAECKALHNGYDCMLRDSKENNGTESCKPWEIDYNYF